MPESELRSDLIAGLKQGVLIAAAALVITLPPAGLATLRSPPPSAAAASAPIERSGPFRPADFGAHAAAPDVRFIADWVADSGDNHGLPYLVLDKRDARVYVFDADCPTAGTWGAQFTRTGGDSAPEVIRVGFDVPLTSDHATAPLTASAPTPLPTSAPGPWSPARAW